VPYSIAQLYAAAVAAGFKGQNAVTATAISLAENSGRNPSAVNHNSNGTTDHGAWQINSVHLTPAFVSTYGNVNDLQDKARRAYAVYKSQGFGAWTTYNSGAYRAHLGEATAVAKKNPSLGKGLLDATLNPIGSLYGIASGNGIGSVNPLGGVNAIGDFFSHLTDSGMWKRIGIGALAVLLILFGVVLMLESNKTTRKVTEMAAMA
jgi:hypothetical protein